MKANGIKVNEIMITNQEIFEKNIQNKKEFFLTKGKKNKVRVFINE